MGGIFEHPRFGLIRSLRAIRDLKKGDELLVNYHMTVAKSPEWYRQVRLASMLKFFVLLRFGSSGCGRQRKMTQQSKGTSTVSTSCKVIGSPYLSLRSSVPPSLRESTWESCRRST